VVARSETQPLGRIIENVVQQLRVASQRHVWTHTLLSKSCMNRAAWSLRAASVTAVARNAASLGPGDLGFVPQFRLRFARPPRAGAFRAPLEPAIPWRAPIP